MDSEMLENKAWFNEKADEPMDGRRYEATDG